MDNGGEKILLNAEETTRSVPKPKFAIGIKIKKQIDSFL